MTARPMPTRRPYLRIRPAVAGDSNALAALHATLFDPPWRADAFRRLLTADTTLGRVAVVRDGEIAGVVLAQVVQDEAEILTIGVAEARQSAGLGSRLLTALCNALRARGVTRLHLDVAADNATARALYARHGFADTGRRATYYTSNPAGLAISMAKEIEPAP